MDAPFIRIALIRQPVAISIRRYALRPLFLGPLALSIDRRPRLCSSRTLFLLAPSKQRLATEPQEQPSESDH